MNKIEIVTSVGFYHFICWKDARYKKLKKMVATVA
jgi:hypothetical protein